MKKVSLFFVLWTVILLAFAGCAKPPIEDMENAKAAVARAESDPDVRLYAPNSLARARDMLNNMNAAAEQKLYDQAKKMAADTVSLAEKAISDGKSAAARAKDDAQNAINAMLAEVDETDGNIKNARAQGQKGIDFKEIDNDFAAAKEGSEQAQAANTEKRYRDAIDGSQTVRNQLSNINSKIGQGALSQSRKK